MRFACIDCGSNTTILIVVEKTNSGVITLEEEIAYTRLSERCTGCQ